MEHPDAPLLVGGVRGIVLASRYLIQPCGSGKSRVTHISRVDMRYVKLTKLPNDDKTSVLLENLN